MQNQGEESFTTFSFDTVSNRSCARMEFFNQYCSSCDRLNIDRKRLIEMIIARIDGKSLLYVGPEGDISENWTMSNKGEECVDNFLKS